MNVQLQVKTELGLLGIVQKLEPFQKTFDHKTGQSKQAKSLNLKEFGITLIKFNLHDSLRFGFNLEFLVKSSFMLPFIHITLGLLNGDNNMYRII